MANRLLSEKGENETRSEMSVTMEPRSIGKIAHIHLYPVKSCAGIEIQSARMTKQGLETVTSSPVKDREYMLVEARRETPTGRHKFITQRDRGAQKMALITPVITNGRLKLGWGGQDMVEVSGLSSGGELPVRVFGYPVTGLDQGDEVAKMLSEYLGMPVRLVRAAGRFFRKASQHYVENDNTLNYQDAYSISWLFQESIDELQALVGGRLSYASFRPNIVAEGGSPSLEHSFYNIRFGAVDGIQPKPGTRCMIVNVDQSTGVMQRSGTLPLSAIFDNFNWTDKAGKRQPIFAENFLPLNEGKIGVSEEIVASSERNPHLDVVPSAPSAGPC